MQRYEMKRYGGVGECLLKSLKFETKLPSLIQILCSDYISKNISKNEKSTHSTNEDTL